jgi:predicted phage-related endonuclease
VTIGGSDAAAAAGIDPYCSRVMAWVYKTGRAERPETEAMRWGTRLQPLVFEELRERGIEAWECSEGYRDKGLADHDHPWRVGHPDGFAQDDNGPYAVVEVKTTNGWAHRAAEGVPLHHVAQLQHYLYLTGLQRGLLAVLVNGQHLEVHEVARNDAAIDLLMAAEERFHWHCVTDTQPPLTDADTDAVKALWPQAVEGRRVRLDAEAMRDLAELRARREQAKAIEAQVTALENRLKARMGDTEVAVSPTDDEVLRWTNVGTRRLDSKRLAVELPAVAEQFTTPTTTRRFHVV